MLAINKLFSILIVFLLGFTSACSSIFNRTIPLNERWIVGVLPAQNKSGNPLADQYSEAIQNSIIDELHATQKFRLIERAKISAVLSEIKLQQLGIIDSAKAAEVGKLLGVESVLVIDVQSFRNEKVNSLKIGSVVKIQKEIAQSSIHTRLIHVETGEILATGDADGNIESGSNLSSTVGGAGSGPENVVSSLINQSSKVIAKKISDNVIPKK